MRKSIESVRILKRTDNVFSNIVLLEIAKNSKKSRSVSGTPEKQHTHTKLGVFHFGVSID